MPDSGRRFTIPFDWSANSIEAKPKDKFDSQEVWEGLDKSVRHLFGDGHAQTEVKRKAALLGSLEALFNEGMTFMELIKITEDCVGKDGIVNRHAFKALLAEIEDEQD